MDRSAPAPTAQLPARARVFLVAIATAGALVVALSIVRAVQQPSTAGWLILAGLGLLTGYLPIKVPGIDTRFSLSDGLIFTSILLFGPERAVIVAGLDALAASRFNRGDRQFASRTVFNVAAATVAVWVPGHLFFALLGQPQGALDAAGVWPFVVALTAMAVCYSLLSTGAIATVLALTRQSRITSVWRENFAWVWIAHAWSAVAAAAIAIYAPRVGLVSLVVIGAVAGIGYATVRVYLRTVEESTTHLQKLNDLYLATIKALAMAIDAKDQVTHGHIRRVQIYTVGLARALGITDELSLKGIEAGALLHDTGKIAVPEHILNKPGKLTAQEYERMKTHVTVGAEILSGIHFPFPVIPFVRHHHENWDGTGYPDGLKGEAIPLGARILSVVDCFDALTSDRPYRRALTADDAIAILRERAGTMYDERIVAKFVEVLPQLTATLADDEHPAMAAVLSGAANDTSTTPEEPAEAHRDVVPELETIQRLAASGLRPQETAFIVVNRLRSRLRFAASAVYMPSASNDGLEAIHVGGRHADLFRHSDIRLGEGLSGWVAAHGQMVVNANPTLDLQGPVASAEIQLGSALVVPVPAEHASRGALALYATAPNAFTLEDAHVATVAASFLSRALRASTDIPAIVAQAKHCA